VNWEVKKIFLADEKIRSLKRERRSAHTGVRLGGKKNADNQFGSFEAGAKKNSG